MAGRHNTALTEKAALRVKGLNATIVAVGFGDAYDLELKKIASRPEYVFKAKNMSQLSDTKWTVAELICKASEELAVPTPPVEEACDY
ncbi:hypothetical protein Btru_057174 [Bulinus truncatus]|nr:hypothetical protein Btru_057174 [Bulinus truncatus]